MESAPSFRTTLLASLALGAGPPAGRVTRPGARPRGGTLCAADGATLDACPQAL